MLFPKFEKKYSDFARQYIGKVKVKTSIQRMTCTEYCQDNSMIINTISSNCHITDILLSFAIVKIKLVTEVLNSKDYEKINSIFRFFYHGYC